MKLKSSVKTNEHKERLHQYLTNNLTNIDLLNIRYSPSKPPMLILPISVAYDFLESLSKILGFEAAISMLYHIGKEWGYRNYLNLRKKKFYFNGINQYNSVQSILRTKPILDFMVDPDLKEGRILVKVFGINRSLINSITQPPLISYIAKGFIQAFLGNLLNSNIEVCNGAYFSNKNKVKLFEIPFRF